MKADVDRTDIGQAAANRMVLQQTNRSEKRLTFPEGGEKSTMRSLWSVVFARESHDVT